MSDLFYGFMSVFTAIPLLAAAPAIAFFFMYRATNRRLIAVTSASWALYAVYELSIRLGFGCSGECNIRVDLLVIYPVLLVMSVLAIVFFFKSRG